MVSDYEAVKLGVGRVLKSQSALEHITFFFFFATMLYFPFKLKFILALFCLHSGILQSSVLNIFKMYM